jgi:hypothetical protein
LKISKDIKNLLSEALGVPDNLVNLASAFYSALVDRIPNNGTFDNLQNEVFEFGGKFNIADYKFKGVKFILELHENDDIDILGLSTKNLSRVTKKFKIKTKVNHGVLDISMVFAVPKNVKGKDLKKFLIDNKYIDIKDFIDFILLSIVISGILTIPIAFVIEIIMLIITGYYLITLMDIIYYYLIIFLSIIIIGVVVIIFKRNLYK